MRCLPRLSCALALLSVPALMPAAVPLAGAAATHVVIGEFATRGPSAATDEFVELANRNRWGRD